VIVARCRRSVNGFVRSQHNLFMDNKINSVNGVEVVQS